MSNQTQRLFIALNLPQEVVNEISFLINQLVPKSKGIKWVAPQNLHLTLKFLGVVDSKQRQQIEENLLKTSGEKGGVAFQLGDIKAFPDLSYPRVIYIECQEVDGSYIFGLERKITENMQKLGFDAGKREWKPHISLGRIKASNYKLPPLDKIKYSYQEFQINTFDLMSSVLQKEGPQYFIEKRYKI